METLAQPDEVVRHNVRRKLVSQGRRRRHATTQVVEPSANGQASGTCDLLTPDLFNTSAYL